MLTLYKHTVNPLCTMALHFCSPFPNLLALAWRTDQKRWTWPTKTSPWRNWMSCRHFHGLCITESVNTEKGWPGPWKFGHLSNWSLPTRLRYQIISFRPQTNQTYTTYLTRPHHTIVGGLEHPIHTHTYIRTYIGIPYINHDTYIIHIYTSKLSIF